MTAPSPNASSVLRRLPSPTSSARGLDATGGAGGAVSSEASKAESAAKRIQFSWRRYLLEARAAKALTAASPAYARIQQFLDKVRMLHAYGYLCIYIYIYIYVQRREGSVLGPQQMGPNGWLSASRAIDMHPVSHTLHTRPFVQTRSSRGGACVNSN